MKSQQRGIQSVELGCALLLALARSRSPMQLRDLAKAADMTPSKAHPYLVSFGKLKLIAQDPATGQYDLGEEALQIGLASFQRLSPLRIAQEELKHIEVDSQYSTAVSVWGNQGPTIVQFTEADYPLQVYIRSGTVLSLANTAAGQVFAAFMPRPVVVGALKHERSRFAGRSEPISVAALDEIVAEVRKLGIARSIGTVVPGVNSISAPVFNDRGELVMAISVMKPGLPADADPKGATARAAKQSAMRISQRLGFRPPD
ncbi:IclR family transcriptional regulator [Reyranella sp. CPCC 100927]|uniref:IclR family transcriptional regulator n=1 Tax=Reyranella sp. CPCC 100927 TaxID=2599616 RepID=UPI0015B63C05|nr:IclR family transcriptional regulator [Reyranella sp. CPCC 100927]